MVCSRTTRKLWSSAGQGLASAQYHLGKIFHDGKLGVEQNKSRAVELWESATAQGNTDAQCDLGVLYFTGEMVPKDQARAMELLKKASSKGDADAQYNLGVIYHQGDLDQRDESKAAEFWSLAAAQGHTRAKSDLNAHYGDSGKRTSRTSREPTEFEKRLAEAQFEMGKILH